MARCLFVEPFYGGSHRAFTDGLVRHSRHEYALLTLDGTEWRKRMRRGAIELAEQAVGNNDRFDVLIASDMLDLPAFLSLTRPRFERVPVLLYFHENQFTYPRLKGTKLNSWFGQVNYLSALAADAVAFNSAFHREEFVGALRTMAVEPNNWLLESSIDAIEEKSSVLPVGVELGWIDALGPGPSERGPVVLWNHRWEFDKAPQVFVHALEDLADEGLPFEVIVAGEPGDNPHPALVELRERLPGRVRHHGFASSRDAYGRLLWESRVVVSTTRHEFFGISTVEAMAAGCLPIAPDWFTYPMLVPGELHERCLFTTDEELRARLRRELSGEAGVPVEALQASAWRFDWSRVAPAWDDAIDRLRGSAHGGPGRTRYN